MADFGIQTFIQGTSFDAVNSIDFNYVIDEFKISPGSGSKRYTIQSGTVLKAFLFNDTARFSNTTLNVSVTGNAVSWETNVSCEIIVTMEYQ